MKLFLVVALLLQLPAQRPKQDAPLSPAQLIEFRTKVEAYAQKFYGELVPGTTVKVFMRSEQEWMVLLTPKTGSPVVHLMDVRDVDHPRTIETFVPIRKKK